LTFFVCLKSDFGENLHGESHVIKLLTFVLYLKYSKVKLFWRVYWTT